LSHSYGNKWDTNKKEQGKAGRKEQQIGKKLKGMGNERAETSRGLGVYYVTVWMGCLVGRERGKGDKHRLKDHR